MFTLRIMIISLVTLDEDIKRWHPGKTYTNTPEHFDRVMYFEASAPLFDDLN